MIAFQNWRRSIVRGDSRDVARRPGAPSATGGTLPDTRPPYSMEIGSDDSSTTGFARTCSLAFRHRSRSAASWASTKTGPLHVAGRATAYRAPSPAVDGDTFAQFALGGPESQSAGLELQLSYSYNSPNPDLPPAPYATCWVPIHRRRA